MAAGRASVATTIVIATGITHVISTGREKSNQARAMIYNRDDLNLSSLGSLEMTGCRA
jgi:hypothetical protein